MKHMWVFCLENCHTKSHFICTANGIRFSTMAARRELNVMKLQLHGQLFEQTNNNALHDMTEQHISICDFLYNGNYCEMQLTGSIGRLWACASSSFSSINIQELLWIISTGLYRLYYRQNNHY